MTLRTVRHRIEYGIVLAMRALVSALPDALTRGLGSGIGLAFYVLDPVHRRVAVAQLRAAFPLKSDAECRAIARATFAHFGRLLTVVLRFSTMAPDDIRRRIEVEGEERVHEALAGGRGALMFTGHFGYWELQGLAHPLVLPPLAVLARPIDNPYLHDFMERTRQANGNRVVYRQGALRKVLRVLEANGCVAILIDQHIQPANAVTVDFFNRPASTTNALAMLAMRTGAPLLPIFALPLAGGRFRLVYEHPVPLPPADSEDPIRELTQRCTDVLEMYVRRHPHLWLWMHRRWRADDGGEPARGMFPRAAPDEGEPADL